MTTRPTGGNGGPEPAGGREQRPRHGPRAPGRAVSRWPYALAALLTAALVVAYWQLPLDRLGPRHPAVSWTAFVVALAVVAVLLLWQILDVLAERRTAWPGLVIPLLLCLSVLVFAAAYYALARQPGEVRHLHSRLDALYFTLVSLATIGYGDIAPIGQSARLVAILQILYSFVFLATATTALGRYAQRRLRERSGSREK